jgi:regulator of replication initiation timing
MEHLFKNTHTKELRKWQELLKSLRMENTQLKDRLSGAISREVSNDFVDKAELYQQRFIEKDQVIDILRLEVHYLLQKFSASENSAGNEQQYRVLEKDIEKLIAEFQQMALSFSSFLNQYR